MSKMITLGKQLKNIREKLGYTLQQVAKITDIDFTALSRIEKNERIPTQKQVKALSDCYNIPIIEIRKKIIAQKMSELISDVDNIEEIFIELKILLNSTQSELIMAKQRKHPYMGKKGETFFIRSSGLGEYKLFHLINKKNFDMIEMNFDSEIDAKNYAKQNGLNIENYKEK